MFLALKLTILALINKLALIQHLVKPKDLQYKGQIQQMCNIFQIKQSAKTIIIKWNILPLGQVFLT